MVEIRMVDGNEMTEMDKIVASFVEHARIQGMEHNLDEEAIMNILETVVACFIINLVRSDAWDEAVVAFSKGVIVRIEHARNVPMAFTEGSA